MVCRNHKGKFLGGLYKSICVDSGFMAECVALKEALVVSNRFKDNQVCIETDCESLFKFLMSNSLKGFDWKCFNILEEVLALKNLAGNVGFTLVSRHGNSAADHLAACGIEKMGFRWHQLLLRFFFMLIWLELAILVFLLLSSDLVLVNL